ncbi:MAG: hypothetical protein KatS3mg070_1556 [Meiothermus sp.]|uniref:hypothetical protein n=1 Tax=Meiothermus sp. TaxID=1955249 RepID=UPI0021DC8631|nr:hypothetical protein [Meiothermus sp.]GIW28193.1 MAG: hypothetical protein KatS3mg070_1556 [Meiothermus sp.]
MKSRIDRLFERLTRPETTITIERSYGKPSQPLTREQEAELERLCEQVRREHPHAILVVRYTRDGKVTVTPTGEG